MIPIRLCNFIEVCLLARPLVFFTQHLMISSGLNLWIRLRPAMLVLVLAVLTLSCGHLQGQGSRTPWTSSKVTGSKFRTVLTVQRRTEQSREAAAITLSSGDHARLVTSSVSPV